DTELTLCHGILEPIANSDPVVTDKHRAATGPWRFRANSQTLIRSKDQCCQMTLSSNNEYNQKYHLTYLGQWMNKELSLAVYV
ncbi:hypothetical protein ACQP3L_35820, partial [Escherichia coli]